MADWMSRWELFKRSAAQAYRFQTPEDLIHHTFISLKYNYLYAVNPKVGCSTIKRLLIEAEYEGKVQLYEEPAYVHYFEFLPLLNARQVGDFKAFVQRKDIFKFCFVRNPFTRLLSCYLDKIQKRKPENTTLMIETGLGLYSEKVLSFEEFIEAIIAQPIRHMNPHWRTQYYITFQEGIQYDLIGRFERFESDLRAVSEQIGIDFDRYYLTQTSHATGASAQLEAFYTPDLVKKVVTKFEIDFDYFGYSKELDV